MTTLKKLLPLAVVFALMHTAPTLAAPIKAGVTAAVRGQIDVLSIVEGSERLAKSGEDVYLGDSINSHEDAGMQLMLLDETVFTVGADTEFVIDDFVYDPVTGVGNVSASLAKGVLRFVTGSIAQGDPEDMQINLPAGTIGIRGTFGIVSLQNNQILVVMLGPGFDNNTGARFGFLEVTSGGQTVSLTSPQFGTTFGIGEIPAPPFLLSNEEIAGIMASLEPQSKPSDSEDSGGEGGSKGSSTGGGAGGLAGQTLASGGLFASDTQSFGQLSGGFTDTGDQGLLTASSILDGLTSYDQLRSIEIGTAVYFGAGDFVQFLQDGLPVNKVGTFSIILDVDFGARTIGGGTSVIFVDTFVGGMVDGDIVDSALITSTSYANDIGLVTGVLNSGDLADNGSTCFVCFAGTELSILNAGGVIAAVGSATIFYSNGADVGIGSGSTVGIFSPQ